MKRISLFSFLVPICLLIAVTGIYLFSRSEPLFLLKSIKVKGVSQLSESEIVKRISPYLKESIFRTDMNKVREVVAAHPFVKDVRVRRVFPFSILVDIREKTPSAIWVGTRGDLTILDEDGRSYRGLARGDGKDMLLINTPEKGAARSIYREVCSWDQQGIMKKEAISEVAYQDGNMTVFNVEDAVEIVLGKEDQAERLKRALSVLEDAKKRGLLIRCIDARFENGAIVKERTG